MGLLFKRLGSDDDRPPFDCGDSDLNEFFSKDSKEGFHQRVSVTYAVMNNDEIVGFFCVSNDSIRKMDTSGSKFKKIKSSMPAGKRYSSMPAVKIGRLATSSNLQRGGVGTEVLDLIKMWFTNGNKTGCRFIVVDALNKEKVLNFYKKNGFEFLDEHTASDKDHTRLMFFDLLIFKC